MDPAWSNILLFLLGLLVYFVCHIFFCLITWIDLSFSPFAFFLLSAFKGKGIWRSFSSPPHFPVLHILTVWVDLLLSHIGARLIKLTVSIMIFVLVKKKFTLCAVGAFILMSRWKTELCFYCCISDLYCYVLVFTLRDQRFVKSTLWETTD